MKFYNPFKLHIVTDGDKFFVRKYILGYGFAVYVNQSPSSYENWPCLAGCILTDSGFPASRLRCQTNTKNDAIYLLRRIDKWKKVPKLKVITVVD